MRANSGMKPPVRRPASGTAVLVLVVLACAWGLALGASQKPTPLEPAPASEDTAVVEYGMVPGERCAGPVAAGREASASPRWDDLMASLHTRTSLFAGTPGDEDARLEYAAHLPIPGSGLDPASLLTETAVLEFGDLTVPSRTGGADPSGRSGGPVGLGLSGAPAARLDRDLP